MSDWYKCKEGPFLCSCTVHLEVGNSRALRPAPELPKGYELGDEDCLWSPDHQVAKFYSDCALLFSRHGVRLELGAIDMDAVCIAWLKRRSK